MALRFQGLPALAVSLDDNRAHDVEAFRPAARVTAALAKASLEPRAWRAIVCGSAAVAWLGHDTLVKNLLGLPCQPFRLNPMVCRRSWGFKRGQMQTTRGCARSSAAC